MLPVGYKCGPFGNEIKRVTEQVSIDWVLAPSDAVLEAEVGLEQ